jgi:4-hydroxy-2-oxoheptanedioate aldolase
VGVWCSSGDSLVAETLAAAGFDYVCIDMQHGESQLGNLVEMVQAVQAGGSAPVVRVPENSLAMINKAVDVGALGIVIPLVEDAAGARRAVEAVRFPPRGRRSYGPFRASLPSSRGKELADLEDVAVVPMIETPGGLANVAQIAAVDGVSVVYVGPSDLSLALGLPPGSVDDPKFSEALERVQQAAADAGIVAGMHTHSGARAATYVAQGFGMVTAAGDLSSLLAAVSGHLETARSGVPVV